MRQPTSKPGNWDASLHPAAVTNLRGRLGVHHTPGGQPPQARSNGRQGMGTMLGGDTKRDPLSAFLSATKT